MVTWDTTSDITGKHGGILCLQWIQHQVSTVTLVAYYGDHGYNIRYRQLPWCHIMVTMDTTLGINSYHGGIL